MSQTFDARGVAHTVTREPGGTPLAEKVRGLALEPPGERPLSPLAMALLMNAARADHLDQLIVPRLRAGQHVICDRFADSTIAYQSAEGGISLPALMTLQTLVLGDLVPDLTLLLDADPRDLLARREQRGGSMDVFESRGLAFHDRVREAFLEIATNNPDRVVVLDARQSADALYVAALDAIARTRSGRDKT